MASRRRLGVALLIPEPHRTEIQGLRRALGDGALERIPPHLTLVPPVNVREERLDDALRVLREAAGSLARPLRLALGPAATFLPDNPVTYLQVNGDVDALRTLRDRVFREPLERPLTWPFVPHITLADDASEERIASALTALADYTVGLEIRAVHLLEEQERRWHPIAEARIAPTATVGRGGLPLELSVSGVLDPQAAAFARSEWDRFDAAQYGEAAAASEPLVVVARREGGVAGIARGELHRHNRTAHLSELIVGAAERGTGVGAHLLTAVEAEARAAGCTRLTVHADPATPAAAFYRDRGFADEVALPAWKFGRDFVRLVRWLR